MDAVQAGRPFIMANAYRLEADNQQIADALQTQFQLPRGTGRTPRRKIKRLLRQVLRSL